jgi:hypothetical protein
MDLEGKVEIETFKMGIGEFLYAATFYELREVISIRLLRGLALFFRSSQAACYWPKSLSGAGGGLPKTPPLREARWGS